MTREYSSGIRWRKRTPTDIIKSDTLDVWRFSNNDPNRMSTIVRKILAEYVTLDLEEIIIERSENGKPYSHQLIEKGFFFNYSHSHRIVLLVVSRKQEIGVDVEHIYQPLDLEALIKVSLTEKEINTIGEFPNDRVAILSYWTRKESIIKAKGIGHSIKLSEMNIKLDHEDDTGSLFSQNLFIRTFRPAFGYIASIAVNSPIQLDLNFYNAIA